MAIIDDKGLSVDEVYGALQGLTEKLMQLAEAANAQLADGTAIDDLTASYGADSNVIAADPSSSIYDGTAGEFGLELVVDDVNEPPVTPTQQTPVRFPEALAAAVSATVGGAPPRIERTSIGDSVVARVRFPLRQVGSKADADRVVEALTERGWGSTVETLHHLAFDPGKISFKPGRISFKPGRISFKPGLLFTPGRISFKPAVILPQPAECDTESLNAILFTRWQAAMGAIAPERIPIVAVLDTGINRHVLEHHPLFAGQTVDDGLGASPDLDPEPDGAVVDEYFGHGSLVAGLVAQRAPLARINHESVRNVGGFSDAFELARDLPDVEGADIVVLSFATSAASAEEVPVLRRVVRHLLGNGVVVVCAHGLESDKTDPSHRLFPADFTTTELFPEGGEVTGRLVSVGAVDKDGKPMPGSRADPASVTAPAVGVLSAYPHGQYRFGASGPVLPFCGWARVTGTSFAAPRVAGEIAQRMIDDDVDAATAVDLVIPPPAETS